MFQPTHVIETQTPDGDRTSTLVMLKGSALYMRAEWEQRGPGTGTAWSQGKYGDLLLDGARMPHERGTAWLRNYRQGVDELRHAVQVLNDCREDFLDRFTTDELLRIYRAWMASGWDFYPDQWTRLQVWGALRGIVPDWRGNETPIAYDFQGRR